MIFFFFLKSPCYFYNPANVSNLISGSSFFSKLTLDVWKFLVCIMLKPSMQDFKHEEMSGIVHWFEHSLVLPLEIGMRIDLFLWPGFQSCGHFWVFQISWHIECNTSIASSFRVLNSSTEIPLHPPALWTVELPKAHLTSHSRMSGSGWLTIPSWLSGSLRFFCTVLCTLSITSASTRSLPFLSFIVFFL